MESLYLKTGLTPFTFIGQEAEVDVTDLVRGLRKLGIPFLGGLFPNVYTNGTLSEKNVAVSGLNLLVPPVHLEAPFTKDLIEQLPDLATLQAGLPSSHGEQITALVFLDGTGTDISQLTSALYRKYGLKVRFVGGATGRKGILPGPSIIAPVGSLEGSAVIGFIADEVGVGVQHGWARRVGPLMATRTEGRMILEIDWRPPVDVYFEAVEGVLGKSVDRSDFSEITAMHPLGVSKEGAEDLIRKPISIHENGIRCGGDVPNHSLMYLMEASDSNLLDAASKAAQDSHIEQPSMSFIFDCLARKVRLGEEGFRAEMDRIVETLPQSDGGVFGATTLGEFASSKVGVLEFLNKTVVVATIGANSSDR